MKVVTMSLTSVIDGMRGTLAAGQYTYCCLVMYSLFGLKTEGALKHAHCLHSFWGEHCGSLRGPKALSVFAVHVALVAAGVLQIPAQLVHRHCR